MLYYLKTLLKIDLINIFEENDQAISTAFESLGDINLIDLFLNTGVEYLDNSRIVDEKLQLTTDSINYKNLTKLDWSNELKQMGNILTSAVGILDVLPEEEKNKPISELSSINAETIDELDGEKTEGVLNNFVEELFKSNLINEASTAGLEYVVGTEKVKEIVGEVDKEALKDINIKEDLLKITSAIKSVLIISVNNFTNVNLQNLSSKSIELKNIIDELLELEIFELVEDNVLDYTITNYVENNENIVKFVDVEELKKLGKAELKVELGSMIETFGRLGEETELFNVEGLENTSAKMNYEALDSRTLRIINDNVAESNTIYKFLNQAFKGAFVPTIYATEEEYDNSIKQFEGSTNEETRSNWVVEINVFADLLESIEKEMAISNEKFSIYNMATSENKEIKLGILKGLASKDVNNEEEYLLDESIFVREIMMNTVANSASDNELFDGLFDDENLQYGKELDALVQIMIDGEIVKNDNSYVVEFASLEEKFYSVNEIKLNAYSNHIDESTLLQKIVRKNLEGQVSNELYVGMEDWTPARWEGEFKALSNILIESGMVGKEEVSFDSIFENFDEVSYPQMNAITANISPKDPINDNTNQTEDRSLIVRDILVYAMTVETDENGNKVLDSKGNYVIAEDKEELYNDLKSLDDTGWRNELTVISDVVASETHEENGKWSTMPLSEITSLNCIRPETLDLIANRINETTIIKSALIDPLTSLLTDDNGTEDKNDDVLYSDPNEWDNEQWTNELKSIAYLSYELAEPNESKNNAGYPNDRIYVDFENGLDFEGKIKLSVLNSLLGYNESDGSNNLFRTILKLENLESINKPRQYGINKSTVLQKVFVQAMNDSVNKSDDGYYVVDFNSDKFANGDQFFYEVSALYNVIYNANLYKDGYVIFDEITNSFTNISKEEFVVISNEVPTSELLQQQIQKILHESVDEKYTVNDEVKYDHSYSVDVMDSWDEEKWTFEMAALTSVVMTLDEKEDKENNDKGIDFTIGNVIKVSTIEAVSFEYDSDIVRKTMEDTINDLLVIKPMESVTDNSVATVNYVSPIKVEQFNNYQWKYELETLHKVSVELAEGEGENKVINTNNLTSQLSNKDSSFIKKVQEWIYSDVEINGINKKCNSFILQAQLSPTIENLMNAGDRITNDRIRLLHPETYIGANWNINLNVPAYEECSIDDNAYDLNSDVGEWWSKELAALYAVVADKFEEGTPIDLNGDINFNDTKISTLDAIRDNIDNSYILQSCMRHTIDGILNQNLETYQKDNDRFKRYSKYEYITCENWNCETWYEEIKAIRDVAKTLADYVDEDTANKPTDDAIFAERNEYIPNSWIGLEDLNSNDNKPYDYDSKFVFQLYGMELDNKDNEESVKAISLDTMYFASVHAKDSNLVRSLLRPHILDIMYPDDIEPEDDLIMKTWLDDSTGWNVDGYTNKWDYEMAALFNISGRMSNDEGKIQLDSNMFEKIPVEVIYTINGSFDGNSYVSNKYGYVADYGNQNYQSSIIVSLLKQSLETELVIPTTWDNDQWRYEVYALSQVATYLQDSNGNIVLNGENPVEKGVNVSMLDTLSDVINYSTYMQEKLNDTVFTTEVDLDNNKEIKTNEEIEKEEELKEAFPDFGFSYEKNQWNGELKALYNVVNGTEYVDEDGLFDYNINFNGSIHYSIFEHISENINQSTYLQSKLEGPIEGLIPQETIEKDDGTIEENPYYVMDRTEYFEADYYCEDEYGVKTWHTYGQSTENDHTCLKCGYIKDYHLERYEDELGKVTYDFNLKLMYDESLEPNYHAWSVELKTIFGILLAPESNMVDDDGYVKIEGVDDKLHELSVDILSLTGDKLDEFGHDAYHSSNVTRLNLIRPLEELAYNTVDDSDIYDKKAYISYRNGFRWIDEPVDKEDAQKHEFTWIESTTESGTYIINSTYNGENQLHRYDGSNSFSYSSNGNVVAQLEGWKTTDKSNQEYYIYDLEEELQLESETSTTKTYIQYGRDRDGEKHETYMMDINNDGTGTWYCINQNSELHELESFFKLIGAETISDAKEILTLTSDNTMADILALFVTRGVLDEVRFLANESYLINLVFENRGIDIHNKIYG